MRKQFAKMMMQTTKVKYGIKNVLFFGVFFLSMNQDVSRDVIRNKKLSGSERFSLGRRSDNQRRRT